MPRPQVQSDGAWLRLSSSEWRAPTSPAPSEGWYPTTDGRPAQASRYLAYCASGREAAPTHAERLGISLVPGYMLEQADG
jgi:hypothetical protein